MVVAAGVGDVGGFAYSEIWFGGFFTLEIKPCKSLDARLDIRHPPFPCNLLLLEESHFSSAR